MDNAALPALGFPIREIRGSMAIQRLTAAYRSRSRPSSTLGAKASTMCPYYLDGSFRLMCFGDRAVRKRTAFEEIAEITWISFFKGHRRFRSVETPRARSDAPNTRSFLATVQFSRSAAEAPRRTATPGEPVSRRQRGRSLKTHRHTCNRPEGDCIGRTQQPCVPLLPKALEKISSGVKTSR